MLFFTLVLQINEILPFALVIQVNELHHFVTVPQLNEIHKIFQIFTIQPLLRVVRIFLERSMFIKLSIIRIKLYIIEFFIIRRELFQIIVLPYFTFTVVLLNFLISIFYYFYSFSNYKFIFVCVVWLPFGLSFVLRVYSQFLAIHFLYKDWPFSLFVTNSTFLRSLFRSDAFFNIALL